MMVTTTFVVEFASRAELSDFVAGVNSGGLRPLLGDIVLEFLGVHGSRRGKFAAKVVVPILLSVAGNLATDTVRDAAKAAWEEILQYAHEIRTPPTNVQISDPPQLIDTKLPVTPDPRGSAKKKKRQRRS